MACAVPPPECIPGTNPDSFRANRKWHVPLQQFHLLMVRPSQLVVSCTWDRRSTSRPLSRSCHCHHRVHVSYSAVLVSSQVEVEEVLPTFPHCLGRLRGPLSV